ncbi:MAG: tyrosine-type recombinase/integrase [Planctomycetaceae bacterium]|jgi:integrase|nr:tyrosine-type recombinase/integrase [Planctomycetaceae bacterium]
MKLRELYEKHYLPVLKENNRSVKTINSYTKTVQRWEDTFAEKQEPDATKVTKEHVNMFKKHLATCRGLKGNPFADNTIRRYLRELSPLLAVTTASGSRDCPGLGLRAAKPKIEMPTEVFRDAEDTLTFEEISAWMEAAKNMKHVPIDGIEYGIWWECFLTLMYNTGIRVGTALKMRWDWVDFRNHIIRIKKADNVKTKYIISLNAEAMEVLKTMQELSKTVTKNSIVFKWGMHSQTIYYHANKHLKAAGIPQERRFKFHSIRKHFGSELMKESLAAAAKGLGHRNQQTALNYYGNSKQMCDPFVERITPIRSKITPPPIAPQPICVPGSGTVNISWLW